MFHKSESRSKVTIASGKPSHMVVVLGLWFVNGCSIPFELSMFWDSVPCIRSIPMHCFLDGVRVGRSSTSRRVSGRSGVFLHAVLLQRFSVLLPHQADFDFVHSTVVAKRSHFADVCNVESDHYLLIPPIGLRFSSSVIKDFDHWVADTGSHSVLAARVGCPVCCGQEISRRYTRGLQFSCLFLK